MLRAAFALALLRPLACRRPVTGVANELEETETETEKAVPAKEYMLEAGDVEEEVNFLDLLDEDLRSQGFPPLSSRSPSDVDKWRAVHDALLQVPRQPEDRTAAAHHFDAAYHRVRLVATSGSLPNATSLLDVKAHGGSGDVTLVAQLIMKKTCLLAEAMKVDDASKDPRQKKEHTVSTILIQKFAGIKAIRDYGNVASRAFAYTTSAAFRALLTKNTEYNNQMAAKSFSWVDEKKKCAEVVGGSEVAVFGRLAAEAEMCEYDADKNCVESAAPDKFCPEGFAAAYRRGFNVIKATAAAPVGYAIGWFSTALAGIVVGALVVNPVSLAGIAAGATAGFLFQACCVPIDFVIAGAFTAYMGTETASCKCFETNCRFESAQNSCEVLAVDGEGMPVSDNPFGWLPYPGKRCDYDVKSKKCKLESCNDLDFVKPLTHGFFGTVGKVRSAEHPHWGVQSVANCVSTTNHLGGAMTHHRQLGGKPNNQNTRNAIYAQLGVTKLSFQAVAFKPDEHEEQDVPKLDLSQEELTQSLSMATK